MRGFIDYPRAFCLFFVQGLMVFGGGMEQGCHDDERFVNNRGYGL